MTSRGEREVADFIGAADGSVAGLALLEVAIRASAGRTVQARRLRRALARAGRAAQLGLHLLPGLVLAEVLEVSEDTLISPPFSIVVHVWGGSFEEADAIVEQHRPAGLKVIIVHRRAGWTHRARAWWREKSWRP